jgi:hypothetical protein
MCPLGFRSMCNAEIRAYLETFVVFLRHFKALTE